MAIRNLFPQLRCKNKFPGAKQQGVATDYTNLHGWIQKIIYKVNIKRFAFSFVP
jgi:hypothetical protein